MQTNYEACRIITYFATLNFYVSMFQLAMAFDFVKPDINVDYQPLL